jgi:hypothetical protein
LPEPALLVSRTLPPVQKVVGPDATIVGAAGGGLTCTITGADSTLQPLPSVKTTV